jgi:hypothetical protein
MIPTTWIVFLIDALSAVVVMQQAQGVKAIATAP